MESQKKIELRLREKSSEKVHDLWSLVGDLPSLLFACAKVFWLRAVRARKEEEKFCKEVELSLTFWSFLPFSLIIFVSFARNLEWKTSLIWRSSFHRLLWLTIFLSFSIRFLSHGQPTVEFISLPTAIFLVKNLNSHLCPWILEERS